MLPTGAAACATHVLELSSTVFVKYGIGVQFFVQRFVCRTRVGNLELL